MRREGSLGMTIYLRPLLWTFMDRRLSIDCLSEQISLNSNSTTISKMTSGKKQRSMFFFFEFSFDALNI